MFERLVVAILFLTCLAGCQRVEEIRTIDVPKDQSGLEMLDRRPPIMAQLNNSPQPAAKPHRIVVAISQTEQATWFFKIAGEPAEIAATESEWRPFFEKLDFDDEGKPKYELPDHWKALGGRQFRYETLQFSESPRMEITISELSGRQSLVDNVNRWRVDQLSMAAADAAGLNLTKFQSAAGEMLLFDETGTTGSGGGMMSGAPQPPVTRTLPETKFEYELSEEWIDQPTIEMVKIKKQKKSGDQNAQITVTQMSAVANQWEPNVQTWANAIGINTMAAPEFMVRTTDIDISQIKAKRLRLIEPDEDIKLATIAIMLEKGDAAWFFKLTGDKKLVEASEKEFDAFVASFQFVSSDADNSNSKTPDSKDN